MAESSLAQSFALGYGGNRRIETGRNTPEQRAKTKPTAFGQAATAYHQKPQGIQRAELSAWLEADAIESLNRPVYEARRMVGDTATIWHIDYNPTAAMTPRWEAYGTAYGVRFIVTLWQEDIGFINTVTVAGIGKTNYTPSKPLEVVVKRYDAHRGLVGAMAIFHEHKAIFVGEETPMVRKFQPKAQPARQVWANSPFKTVGGVK
jgi:hypothetical protein